MPFSPTSAFAQANTASPTGRANTAAHMLGAGVLITPLTTGRIIVLCTGVVAQGTSGDGASFQLYWGTGALPTNNDTPGADNGIAFGGLQAIASFVTTELSQSFAISGSFSVTPPQYLGLGVQPSPTTYWVDLGFFSAAGTVTFTTVNLMAWEA